MLPALAISLEVVGFFLAFASYRYWDTDEASAVAMLVVGASLFAIGALLNIRSRGKRCWRCKRALSSKAEKCTGCGAEV
jgi:hypothetical protein